MKRKYIILMIITILMVSLSVGVEAYSENNHYKTIKIAGDNNLPPFEYLDVNGIYKGFNLDIMRAVSLEKGIEIVIVPMNWYEALDSLNDGTVDAVQGMKYSTTRDVNYDFSRPYIQTSHSIFVGSNNKYIYEISDLRDKRVAIQKNDISKYLLNDRKIENIIEVDNQEVALMMLINKEIDAYVGNKLTGVYYIQKKGFENIVKTVGLDLMKEDYCLATLDGNDEVLGIFNDGIDKIIANGTYDKIYKKWFGEKFYNNAKVLRNYLIALGLAFVIAICIVIIISKWNRQLKKKVDERTIELRRENILKEKILDSIFSSIIVIDKSKNILHVNGKALGLMDDEIKSSIQGTIIENIIKKEDIIKVLKKGKEITAREVVCSEDNFSTYQYNLSPILIDNNSHGAVITIKDITEEKILRESLVAKDKLKTLGRLAATVAHEIKNPLTSIKAYVELLPYKYENEKFRNKLLCDVPKEIDRLDKFINDLLNFSHPKKGKKEVIRLNDILESSVRLLSREANKHNISMSYKINGELKLYATKNQLKQVFMNLLINAIDATKDIEDAYIDIGAELKGDFIHIYIEDNGSGIDIQARERIFEPYYTTKSEGIGLGLAITESLVKKNKGEITVVSELGVGTRFLLVFEKH